MLWGTGAELPSRLPLTTEREREIMGGACHMLGLFCSELCRQAPSLKKRGTSNTELG